MKCTDKNKSGKIQSFIKSTKTISAAGLAGATTLPLIGDNFGFIEISATNSGKQDVFVSFQRTDIIQTSKISFYYNRIPILTNGSLKSMGASRKHFLIFDNWETDYTIDKTPTTAIQKQDGLY